MRTKKKDGKIISLNLDEKEIILMNFDKERKYLDEKKKYKKYLTKMIIAYPESFKSKYPLEIEDFEFMKIRIDPFIENFREELRKQDQEFIKGILEGWVQNEIEQLQNLGFDLNQSIRKIKQERVIPLFQELEEKLKL